MMKVITVMRESGADAVHPGYGFLAENSYFAEAVIAAGLTWIGPQPQTIRNMGDKERARVLAGAAGLSLLPGSGRFALGESAVELAATAAEIGYPLLVKAAAAGGGIGMKRVDKPERLEATVEATQRAGLNSFGDGTVYLEKFIARARHVEVQIFGFGDGRAVHLFERDCSIQRRFQKVIEESPAFGLAPETRAAMLNTSVALAAQAYYAGAGTIEFIVDTETQAFFFLEMNTRIQVEHPVTEMIASQDLVALQIRLAADEDLSSLRQEAITTSGHAIECRIYAENTSKIFLPSPGTLTRFDLPPQGEGIRIDSGVRVGDQITIHYDPMIAKLICHSDNRSSAIDKMLGALGSTEIEGLHTNLAFLKRTLDHPAFRAGDVHTGFIEAHRAALMA